MALIRGSGNKDTELRLIAVFRAHAITGWRRGSKLTGKPDFVFPKTRLAIFVDGCFRLGRTSLARLPLARHATKEQRGVLAREVGQESRP